MALPVVDVLVKFGGSAITDKNNLETLRPKELAAAAQCIQRCVGAGLKCIVVHGAGSFGHHQAKAFEVNLGFTDTEREEEVRRKMLGFCLTRQSVIKLNQFVIQSLIEAGVPAVSCSPGSSWETDNKQPIKWPCDTVSHFLRKGFVPVFHGDCTLDSLMGCCILSGDTIIRSLCSFFTIRRVVFLTDVAGVYDKPPHLPDAKLLKTIVVNLSGSVKCSIATSQAEHDVTGGMKLKIKTAVEIVLGSNGQCQVYICEVNKSDADAMTCPHNIVSMDCTVSLSRTLESCDINTTSVKSKKVTNSLKIQVPRFQWNSLPMKSCS